ncbi:MAG: NDP-sugar synthase [Bacillota bacterium]
MIAVVMAGGLGTRLHPLSCLLPKPMLSFFDRPLLSYILQKLLENGFRRVLLTLHYRPEAIMHYFGDGAERGLQIAYSLEREPLGTAGSVRHAVRELGEAVVVLSGDVLFNFNLAPALSFHCQRGALVTMLLLHHHDPRGFGIAALDHDGRVTRYCEKPATPHDVFSNLINTGTYFLEPEALDLIPPQAFFDFSRDLFPLLLKRGMPFYGYVVQGYWSDLGTLEVYRQAHDAAFEGKGGILIPGEQKGPQIWMEEGVNIATGARLHPPLFLGARVCLEKGAVAGPGAVIGADTVIRRGSRVMNSILGKGNHVGVGALLDGAFLAGNNVIGEHCCLREMVVLGGNCRVAERSTLQHDVKIWPHLYLPPRTRLEHATITQ